MQQETRIICGLPKRPKRALDLSQDIKIRTVDSNHFELQFLHDVLFHIYNFVIQPDFNYNSEYLIRKQFSHFRTQIFNEGIKSVSQMDQKELKFRYSDKIAIQNQCITRKINIRSARKIFFMASNRQGIINLNSEKLVVWAKQSKLIGQGTSTFHFNHAMIKQQQFGINKTHHFKFDGHTDWIWSIEFPLDGQLLASRGGGNLIKILDWKQQKEVYQLNGNTHKLRSVIFFSNGLRLASCSKDTTIQRNKRNYLIDWTYSDTFKQQLKMAEHTKIITSIVFSPKEYTLVDGSYDQQIIIWNYQKQQVKKWNSKQEFIQKIKGLEYRNGNKKITLEGHKGEVSSLAFPGSKDRSIILWNIELTLDVFKQDLEQESIYLSYNHQEKSIAYATNVINCYWLIKLL